ncbi:MAG: hypothetical protein HQK96_00900 [Nitrospirae bacterium]|nr:hypothetical protein [Nitrospirota bacterium]
MEEHFWIQGEDGKMEGSLHGVPKQGGENDAAKNRKPNPFLAKLRKRMENKRQNRAALVSDKQPVSSPNTFTERINRQINDLKESADIFLKAAAIAKKEKDKMDVAYDRLKNTPYGNEGVDKFYHSVAHCKIARLGYKGEISSHALGLGKEIYDVLKEHFKNPNPWGTIAKGQDSVEDMKANEIGRQAGINGDPSKSCEELCKGQWPKGIPENYKQ